MHSCYTYVDSSGLASLALTMNKGKATANVHALLGKGDLNITTNPADRYIHKR